MALFLGKSILTTVVLGLAIIQAVTGPRLRGYLKSLPVPVRRPRAWHRWSGDAALVLTIAVATICVSSFGFELYSPRVTWHAILGTMAALVMITKLVIARRIRTHLRYTPILGVVAGFCILGTFVASALWYFRLLL
jgi:hypothetical protein